MGADALPVEQLAGALIAAVEAVIILLAVVQARRPNLANS